MANKYYFKVPYTCTTYGTVTGYVIADNEDEAIDKIGDREFTDEDYSDSDSDGYNLDCSEGDITVHEYDIYGDESDDYENDEYNNDNYCEDDDVLSKIPSYYLSEIMLI